MGAQEQPRLRVVFETSERMELEMAQELLRQAGIRSYPTYTRGMPTYLRHGYGDVVFHGAYPLVLCVEEADHPAAQELVEHFFQTPSTDAGQQEEEEVSGGMPHLLDYERRRRWSIGILRWLALWGIAAYLLMDLLFWKFL